MLAVKQGSQNFSYLQEVMVQGLKPVLEIDAPHLLITSQMIENRCPLYGLQYSFPVVASQTN